MKQCFFLIVIVLFAVACNNTPATPDAAAAETKKEMPAMPMMPTYSSDFSIGNYDYAKMIVQGSWKDWQDNTMDNMKSWIADTITVLQSNGKMIKGADSLIANWKRGRASYTSIIDTVNAVVPVYSNDKKENWVLVWATEINTDMKGVKDTVNFMETWRINKDGKADMVFQYDRNQRKE